MLGLISLCFLAYVAAVPDSDITSSWHISNSKLGCADTACSTVMFNMDILTDMPRFSGNCESQSIAANVETGWKPCYFTSDDKSVTAVEYNVALGPKLAASEDPSIGSRLKIRAITADG